MVTGPPAWSRRRKRIEELSVEVLALHREGEATAAKKKLAELVKLVEQHNAYYPIEANLPIDPETGQTVELGEPWKPLPRPTLESLLEEEARRENGPASLAWTEEPDALEVSFDGLREDGGDERFTVRLDDEALTCRTSEREIARVATPSIEELVARRRLEIVTLDAKTIRLPFRVDEAALAALARELGSRLRAMRAATADYRGVPADD